MSTKIRSTAEIYETINHSVLKTIAGGIYIGVSLGICFTMFFINRHSTDFEVLEYVWLLGCSFLAFIFGLIMINKSGLSLRLE